MSEPSDDNVRALAEAVADVLTERGLVVPGASSPARVLNATEVARLIGRSRRWVYAHADELGGFRLGDGVRARLGFDVKVIEAWKQERRAAPRPEASRRGPSRGLRLAGDATLIPFEE